MDHDSKTNRTRPGDLPKLDQWSNVECTKIASEDHFSNAVKDKTVQKNIINRFYNFYLGSRVQKGIDVEDIVYSTVSIMPLHEATEEFIFDGSHYNKDGTLFFLTPEEKLKAEIKVAVEKTMKNQKEPVAEVEKLNVEQVEEAEEILNVGNETQLQEVGNAHEDNVVNQTQVQEVSNTHEDNVENQTQEQEEGNAHENKSVPELNDEEQNLVENTENNVDSSSDHDQDIEPDERPTEPRSFSSETVENNENFDLKLPENIRWFNDKREQPDDETNRPQYGPVENAAFIDSCDKLLKVWDTSEDARIVLKYFFGVIALILMRATTKTYKHLVNTFSSNKFLKNLPQKPYIRYFVPHKRCIKSCYRTFSKRDGNLRIMFAKLVINSYYIDVKRRVASDSFSRFKQINIFKVTILAHTANYGLGLLNMLQTIHSKLGDDHLNTIVQVTYCERTAESWRNVKKFMVKYMVNTSKERTHNWARVIDGDYFRDLCCNSNHPLTVILAVFIDKVTGNPGIWESTWVARADNLEAFKKLGLEMYMKYKGT